MRCTFLSLAAAAVLVCASAANAAIIKPSGVTSTLAGDAGSSHLWLLDDNGGFAAAGLQRPVGTATTLPTGASLADALATFGELSGGGHEESWTLGTGSGNPVFSFDLGADTAIGSILLWQYGNNGGCEDCNGNHTRDFEVIFHTEAEGAVFSFLSGGGTEATEFSGTMLRSDAAGATPDTDDNPAQLFGFGASETARYVGLRIATNYLGQPGVVAGGDRYGLGEVRFATEIPEPSSIVFAGLALVGLVGVARRRG